MSTSQQLAIEEIENWRSKARNYSKTDKLGHVLVNSLDLMQNVLVSGARSQSLPFKIRGLSMECASAMAEDPIKEDESRSLHYGITLSLCAFLIALTSGDEEGKTAKDEQQDPQHSADLSPLHSLLGLVKEEQSTPKKGTPQKHKYTKEGEGAVALFRDNASFDASPSRKLRVKEEPKEPAEDNKDYGGLVMMEDIEDEDEEVAEKSGPSSSPAASAASAATAAGAASDPVAIMQMLFSPSRDVVTPSAQAEDNQLPDMNEDSTATTSSSRPVRKRAPSSRASFGGVMTPKKKESAKKKKIKVESDDEPKAFACSDCDRTFDLEADLARHCVSHTGLKCKECGRRTTTEEKLIEHYELRHPGMEVETVEPKEGNPKETDRFPCPSCDKKYGYQSELDVHILTHTGVSPFQCDQCDKAFKQRSHLKDHLRKRHGVLPHECKTCGEKFERVGELAEHKKSVHKKRMVNGVVVTI
ncbi:hypothetical protein PRIPAC_82431 [Pristionchus pacificus]|uniref:Zinc finger protein n=1 Tax=Pristionchus pacificus TaxID=54126 RepID=A0A454Y0T8_PRIPA|nr:hypothetical protein PRIPAC_82431 [Pristionchus pacificus]|eukprot:PDM65302.1 zinc finger protein [Pristionchus pacificus]